MSHVDDGALHAFLDGALEALPGAEADRIREHLDSCDVCSARLEEERALRREASTILAGADVRLEELVPLEELKRRADARRPVRPSAGSRMRRLSWAASVAVALGAGWMLRGATAPTVQDAARFGVPPSTTAEREAAPAEADPASLEEMLVGSVADEATTSARDVSGVRPAASPTATLPPGVMPLTQERMSEALARRTQLGEASAGEVVARADADSAPARSLETQAGALGIEQAVAARRERGLVENLLSDSSRRQTAPVSAALEDRRKAEALALDAVSVAAEPLDQPSPTEQEEGRASELGLPASLAVPGLTVLSVSWLDGSTGGVRVLQLLQTGDTLELVHLPAGADPSEAGTVTADGRLELVVQRGTGWLVARAPVSRDTLAALLRRMDEGR